MSLEISDRDFAINEAVRQFFENKDLPQRPKLQPIRLSDPGSKAELKKIMDRIKATNLYNFCEKIRRYEQ